MDCSETLAFDDGSTICVKAVVEARAGVLGRLQICHRGFNGDRVTFRIGADECGLCRVKDRRAAAPFRRDRERAVRRNRDIEPRRLVHLAPIEPVDAGSESDGHSARFPEHLVVKPCALRRGCTTCDWCGAIRNGIGVDRNLHAALCRGRRRRWGGWRWRRTRRGRRG